MRQLVRRLSSPRIHRNKSGMKALTTKPISIIKFVKKMNQRLRVPFLISPVASAAATEPAGYSPPIPIPAVCVRVVG